MSSSSNGTVTATATATTTVTDSPTSTPAIPPLGPRAGVTDHAVLLNFWFTTGVALATFLLFCFLRTRLRNLYYARRNLGSRAPPKTLNAFISWIRPVININEAEVLAKVGLDAVIYLRYLYLCFRLCIAMALLGLMILVPLNRSERGGDEAAGVPPAVGLTSLSLQGMPEGSKKLWIHVLMSYAFISLTAYGFRQLYQQYVQLRFEFLLYKQKGIHNRSILLWSIPISLRSPMALVSFFESIHLGPVESVVFMPDLQHIEALTADYATALRHLEDVCVQAIGNPVHPIVVQEINAYYQSHYAPKTKPLRHRDSPHSSAESLPLDDGDHPMHERLTAFRDVKHDEEATINSEEDDDVTKVLKRYCLYEPNLFIKRPHTRIVWWSLTKVDAITYWSKRVRRLAAEIKTLRSNLKRTAVTTNIFTNRRPESLANSGVNDFSDSTTAFVTFTSRVNALLAAQAHLSSNSFEMLSSIAPEPRQLLYANLSLLSSPHATRNLAVRSLLVRTLTAVLIIAWSIPLASVAAFLGGAKGLPRLAGFLNNQSWFKQGVLTGIIPPLLVNAFMALLPTLVTWLTMMQGPKSRSELGKAVTDKLFFFNVFNVLLIFMVVTTIFATLEQLWENPPSALLLLGKSLPQYANWFVNYLLSTGIMGPALTMLRIGPLLSWALMRALFTMSPRSHMENDLSSVYLDWGITWPVPMLAFVIICVYSVISPMISVVGIVYFGISLFVWKYQLLYVYLQDYQSGDIFPLIFDRTYYGMCLWALTMVGVMVFKQAWYQAVATGLLLPFIFAWYLWTCRAFAIAGRYIPVELAIAYEKELQRQREGAAKAEEEGVTTSQELRQQEDHEINEEIMITPDDSGPPSPKTPDRPLTEEDTVSLPPEPGSAHALRTVSRQAPSSPEGRPTTADPLLPQAAQSKPATFSIQIEEKGEEEAGGRPTTADIIGQGLSHALPLPPLRQTTFNGQKSSMGGLKPPSLEEMDTYHDTAAFSTMEHERWRKRTEQQAAAAAAKRHQKRPASVAVPLTDYRQPLMRRVDGVLDSDLQTYGHPSLEGDLPALWLPPLIE